MFQAHNIEIYAWGGGIEMIKREARDMALEVSHLPCALCTLA